MTAILDVQLQRLGKHNPLLLKGLYYMFYALLRSDNAAEALQLGKVRCVFIISGIYLFYTEPGYYYLFIYFIYFIFFIFFIFCYSVFFCSSRSNN